MQSQPFTKSISEYINPDEVITIQFRQSIKEIKIERIREYKKNYIIKFKGIDDLESAYRLIGYSLNSNKTINQKTSEYLIGYKVYEVETNVLWGTIQNQVSMGLNTVLEILSEKGEETLLPKSDAIICQINHLKKEIFIDPPVGLKQLN